MAKYIDVEKLIAEIKRRIDSWSIRGENSPVGQGKDTCVSRVTELTDLLSFIDSLQQEQPGVDLEKEITRWLNEGHITDTRFDDYDDADIETTARHFYELGLNARKEE